MTKALKELIENAEVKRTGRFTQLMFISNGRYNGFWRPNGYNRMIVLGRGTDGPWYKIVCDENQCDKFDIYSEYKEINIFPGFNLDIPGEYGVPCIWFTGYYFKIDYSMQLSSLVAELERREK